MSDNDFIARPQPGAGADRAQWASAAQRRTPTIADPFADLLDVLSLRQRRAIVLRLTTGFYEGWRPSRSEIADLVAVELGWLTVEDSADRQRQRSSGRRPEDYIVRVLGSRRQIDRPYL